MDVSSLSSASVWILEKYLDLEAELEKNLASYELAHSVDALYRFLWDYYADWYVEYLKTDESQLTFAKELFRQYVITLSTYAPFETETLWEEFFKEKRLLAFEPKNAMWARDLQVDIYKYNQSQSSQDTLKLQSKEFGVIINFIEQLRSLRGLFAIDPANPLIVYSQTPILFKYLNYIRLVAKAELINKTKTGLYEVDNLGYTFAIEIFDYVKDKDKEIKRTEKIIQDLQKQIGALNGQLQNDKFLANAEIEIVKEKKADLRDRELELNQQEEKLKMLR